MLRRFYLVALREAARDVWGDSAEKVIVDAIPEREREEVLDTKRPDWVTERVIVAYGSHPVGVTPQGAYGTGRSSPLLT